MFITSTPRRRHRHPLPHIPCPPSGAGVEMWANGSALQSIFLWIRDATVHKVTVAQRAPGHSPIKCENVPRIMGGLGGGVVAQDRIVKKGRQQRDANDKGFSAIRSGLKRRRSLHRPEGGAHSSTLGTVATVTRTESGAGQ